MKDMVKNIDDSHSRRRSGKGKNRFNSSVKTYYALGVMFAALIFMILCLTVFFRIGSIKIEGVTLYREDQIVNVGGIRTDMNLLRTDTDKIVNRLKENLVYIDEVEVQKQYPSTVVITCTEAVKAADIEYNDAYYVLSSSGRILESKNPNPTGEIPVITGFELTSTNPGETLESEDGLKAEIIIELLAELEKQGYENVNSIDISARADIVIDYDGRININLGSSVDMEYKLQYFKAVIGALTDDYEGTLIYNGTQSGISAIPKEQELSAPIIEEDSSSQTDESAADADAQWSGDTQTDWTDDTQTDWTDDTQTDWTDDTQTDWTDDTQTDWTDDTQTDWTDDGYTDYSY